MAAMWSASSLRLVTVLSILYAHGIAKGQRRIVRRKIPAYTNVTLGCYNNTELDRLAVGTGSLFTFTNGTTGLGVLQESTSPYLTFTVQKTDDVIYIQCQAVTSSMFDERRHQHPLIAYVAPPLYEIKALYRLEYAPELVTTTTPAPCDTVVCPFVGSAPVEYRFYMNRAGPFSCSGICNTCNRSDSCIPITESKEQQCYTAQDDACFRRVSDNSVIVHPDCYGCLTCEASNTVNGSTKTLRRNYNLNRPTPTLSCGLCKGKETAPGFRFARMPVIVPSANITVGTPELNIYVNFFNKLHTTVTIYNGTTGRPIVMYGSQDFREVPPTLVSSSTCEFQYQLTLLRPSAAASGVLVMEFRSGSESGDAVFKYYRNVTLHVTERPCETVHGKQELACPNGRCVRDWNDQPSCFCNPNHFGRSCQLQCPSANGPSVPVVSREIIIPVGCDVVVIVKCPNPGNRSFSQITWRQNGGLIVAHGRIFQFVHGSISRTYAGNYSCIDTSTSEYLGSVLIDVADSPVLAAGSVVDNQVIRIMNESQVIQLAINSTLTYNAPIVNYTWTATNGSICGWTQDACILQKNSAVLKVIHVACCSGRYRGCAVNDFGQTCVTVQVEVTELDCPATPTLIGYSTEYEGKSGDCYVDFVGGMDVGVTWHPVGATSTSATQQAVSRMEGNSSGCCRRARLAGVHPGNYKACVGFKSGVPLCSKSVSCLSPTMPRPRQSDDDWHPIPGYVGIVVLAIIVATVFRLRYGRKHTGCGRTRETVVSQGRGRVAIAIPEDRLDLLPNEADADHAVEAQSFCETDVTPTGLQPTAIGEQRSEPDPVDKASEVGAIIMAIARRSPAPGSSNPTTYLLNEHQTIRPPPVMSLQRTQRQIARVSPSRAAAADPSRDNDGTPQGNVLATPQQDSNLPKVHDNDHESPAEPLLNSRPEQEENPGVEGRRVYHHHSIPVSGAGRAAVIAQASGSPSKLGTNQEAFSDRPQQISNAEEGGDEDAVPTAYGRRSLKCVAGDVQTRALLHGIEYGLKEDGEPPNRSWQEGVGLQVPIPESGDSHTTLLQQTTGGALKAGCEVNYDEPHKAFPHEDCVGACKLVSDDEPTPHDVTMPLGHDDIAMAKVVTRETGVTKEVTEADVTRKATTQTASALSQLPADHDTRQLMRIPNQGGHLKFDDVVVTFPKDAVREDLVCQALFATTALNEEIQFNCHQFFPKLVIESSAPEELRRPFTIAISTAKKLQRGIHAYVIHTSMPVTANHDCHANRSYVIANGDGKCFLSPERVDGRQVMNLKPTKPFHNSFSVDRQNQTITYSKRRFGCEYVVLATTQDVKVVQRFFHWFNASRQVCRIATFTRRLPPPRGVAVKLQQVLQSVQDPREYPVSQCLAGWEYYDLSPPFLVAPDHHQLCCVFSLSRESAWRVRECPVEAGAVDTEGIMVFEPRELGTGYSSVDGIVRCKRLCRDVNCRDCKPLERSCRFPTSPS